jgi:hypothetical protein
MKAADYNAVTVQALGMRFCDEWKRCKKEICETMQIEEKDFEYSLHWSIMRKLVNGQSSKETTCS